MSDSYLRENDGSDGLNSSSVAENVVGCSIFHICICIIFKVYECFHFCQGTGAYVQSVHIQYHS